MAAPRPQQALVRVEPAALSPQVAPQLVAQRLNAVANLFTAGKDLVEAATDYLKTREAEHTRRTAIEARARVEVARIQADSEVLATAVQRTFDQRDRVLEGLLAELDRAADRGDRGAVEAALGSLVGVLGRSPLGELAQFHRARQGEHVEI
ncbi:MAG: hypothetical protein VKS61_14555 [Candidatus Sericytochromatia bacterium]|nr:hypothetical protein [Candidatus Sericytochromatia bacterium]